MSLCRIGTSDPPVYIDPEVVSMVGLKYGKVVIYERSVSEPRIYANGFTTTKIVELLKAHQQKQAAIPDKPFDYAKCTQLLVAGLCRRAQQELDQDKTVEAGPTDREAILIAGLRRIANRRGDENYLSERVFALKVLRDAGVPEQGAEHEG